VRVIVRVGGPDQQKIGRDQRGVERAPWYKRRKAERGKPLIALESFT
jgi:hypothetical protein